MEDRDGGGIQPSGSDHDGPGAARQDEANADVMLVRHLASPVAAPTRSSEPRNAQAVGIAKWFCGCQVHMCAGCMN